MYNFTEKEIANAHFTLFDIFEHDDDIYMDTSLGMFRRSVEFDTEWEIDVALQVYFTRKDFTMNGWHQVH